MAGENVTIYGCIPDALTLGVLENRWIGIYGSCLMFRFNLLVCEMIMKEIHNEKNYVHRYYFCDVLLRKLEDAEAPRCERWRDRN